LGVGTADLIELKPNAVEAAHRSAACHARRVQAAPRTRDKRPEPRSTLALDEHRKRQRLDGADAAHRHDNGARKIARTRLEHRCYPNARLASVRAGENRVAGVGSPVAHFCSDPSPLKSSSVGVVTAPATMRASRPEGSEPENQPESVIDRA
jgi:hypothetical protein